MNVEVKEYNKEGYKPLVFYSNWRVAILNFNSGSTLKGISYIERHLLTDEVFVLMKGRVTLLIAGKSKKPEQKISAKRMIPFKIYNVKKGVWHAVFMSKSAKILIVENRDTATQNSQYSDFTPSQKEQLKKIWMQM